jgi:hypothetical protein
MCNFMLLKHCSYKYNKNNNVTGHVAMLFITAMHIKCNAPKQNKRIGEKSHIGDDTAIISDYKS